MYFCLSVTSVITTVSTTIQTKSTSLLSESTNPVSSAYSTSIPLKSEARDVLLSSSSRSIPLEAAATDGNGPSASTSLPILPATLRSLSLELIGESTIIPQLVDTDVPAHSTSTATSLPSKNADVAHPFPPRVLNLELQHEVAIIPFTSTPLPLKTVLSNEIFKKEILPSLHGANKILTSKSNAKNIGFHAVIQATNFKNDDRHLVHRELLPTVSSSTTQAWIPTHRVGTTFKTLLVISTSQSRLPSTTVTYKAQTNVPVTSVATRTGLVTTDVTTPSTMPVTSSSHSDVTTTSVLNKVFPKLNVLDDEISKVDVSHRKVPKINALRTQIPILNKTVPKINVLRKEIPQIRIASREIPKINILQTEIPIIRKPIPKINILQTEIPIIRKPIPKINILQTEIPIIRKPIPKINILQTEIPIIRKPIPKINILQTEIPIIRKPIPKHKTSARPRLSDHRVESSVQNRASKTQALRVSKSVNFLLGLVAMLQHHRRVKNDKHRLAKLSVEKVAPSPARYQSSQCQYTGCVNGVCQQVALGTFKCRCNVGFQPSTNINMCVPRECFSLVFSRLNQSQHGKYKC